MDNKKTHQTEQHGEEFIVRIQGQTSRMGTALKICVAISFLVYESAE